MGHTFAGPRDLGSWIASERNLDDDVLALVEEGRVTEARRDVDLGRRFDDEIGARRLGAGLVDGAADVLIGVFTEDVVDTQEVSVTLLTHGVFASVEDLSHALVPRDGRCRLARDGALELDVAVLQAHDVLERSDDLRSAGRVRVLDTHRRRRHGRRRQSGDVLGQHAEFVLALFDQVAHVDLIGQAEALVDSLPRGIGTTNLKFKSCLVIFHPSLSQSLTTRYHSRCLLSLIDSYFQRFQVDLIQ